MTTWSEASTPITLVQYRGLLLAALAVAESPITGFSDGAPQRAFLEGEGRAMANQSAMIAALAQTASPSTCVAAGPSWVDAVMGWFDLDDLSGGKGRIKATKAIWNIEMQCTASAAPMTINSKNAANIQIQARNGVIFQCTQQADVTLSIANNYHGTVQFTARLPGTTGNVPRNTIQSVISGPAGLSLYGLALNPQVRTFTARDQESDSAYIARGLGRWSLIGAGWTAPAFDYLIPKFGNNVAAGASATRWSVDTSNPAGPGSLGISVADAAGPATFATCAAIFDGLIAPGVKPLGTAGILVIPATLHAITVTATIKIDGSNPRAATNAQDAVLRLNSLFPLGPSTLEPDLLSAIIRGAPIQTASIAVSGGFSTISLSLPGFAGVVEVASLSVAAPEVLAADDVLVITCTVTVVP